MLRFSHGRAKLLLQTADSTRTYNPGISACNLHDNIPMYSLGLTAYICRYTYVYIYVYADRDELPRP